VGSIGNFGRALTWFAIAVFNCGATAVEQWRGRDPGICNPLLYRYPFTRAACQSDKCGLSGLTIG
jgi:hypothetical protein